MQEAFFAAVARLPSEHKRIFESVTSVAVADLVDKVLRLSGATLARILDLGAHELGNVYPHPLNAEGLHVLKWLYHEARSDYVVATTAAWDHQQPWPREMIWRAARGGHLDVLVWLNDTINRLGFWAGAGDCDEAAKIGRLDILQYAYSKGVTITEAAARNAAENGHLHILQWMRSALGASLLLSEVAFQHAARRGQLEVLKWGHTQNLLRNPSRLFKGASDYVQDETAAWLFETFGRDACFGDTPTPNLA